MACSFETLKSTVFSQTENHELSFFKKKHRFTVNSVVFRIFV